MNPNDLHKIIKKIKDRKQFLINELDIRNEVTNLFRNENFIQEADVAIPFIILKTKLPKEFLAGYFEIPKEMIDKDFVCLKYNNYLLDCDKFSEKQETKCDIIDIANKEMEKIDSSEIDSEYLKVITEEKTQSVIDNILNNNCSEKTLNDYREDLNNKDILDIRLEKTSLYIKTTKSITVSKLSDIIKIPEEYIEKVPIISSSNFFYINCKEYFSKKEVVEEPYDPEKLVDYLLDIGGDCVQEDILLTGQLYDEITIGLKQNWREMPDDIFIQVEIEDKVVAIAFDQFIQDAKEIISQALFLNPKLFIEVSTPIGTVLLIDTRRWYLEPNFGGAEWFH